MAISYVGSTSSVAFDSDGRMSANKPSATLQGDVMVAFVTTWDAMPTGPSGWTRFAWDNAGAVRVAAFVKTAGTSEPSSYTFDAETSGAVTWGVAIHTYRGVDTDDSIGGMDTSASTTAEALATTPTTTETGAWLVWVSGMRDDGATSSQTCTNTSGSPAVERTDTYGANTGDILFIRAMATYDSGATVTPGAQSRTTTWSSSALDAHVVIGFELRPGAAGSESGGGDLEETQPAFEVSERFERSLYRSHQVVSYVDVTSPTGLTERLAVTDGTIDVDRTAETRRRCTLTCVDPTGKLTPEGVSGILTPYGTEIRPYRGIRYPDGVVEVVPLGVFRISKVDISDDAGILRLGIEASDLSRTIGRDKFIAPYTVEVGVNLVDAVKTLARRTFPELAFNILGTARTVESVRVYDIGDDPWNAMTELALSLGHDLFFDVAGRLCVIPFPDIETLPSPAFTYTEGENCTMLSLSKVLSDSPGYNGVVVLGEAPSDEKPPVMGIAWDEEPTSATYRKGPYGEVPMFHTDQLVKTEQEANDTAAALLKNQLGFSSQLSLTALPNPLFECGDVVGVTRALSRVDDLYVLDSFNIPLGASGTQDLSLRQRKEGE